jgi:two-component system sensor histidine kinase PilS (NtrC family)
MSALLCLLFSSGLGDEFLGAQKPHIFMQACYIYLGICSLSFVAYLFTLLIAQANHVLFLLIIDFIALVVMIHASSNAIGGLGYLLLIPMAVGSTFLRGKTSVALAAFASILIMAPNLIDSFEGTGKNQGLFTSGLTGAILFITAISFRLLSKKIQSSEYKIQRQTELTDYLQGINNRIIETIQAGILVVDSQLNILLINNAAQTLLSKNKEFQLLEDINKVFIVLKKWQITARTPSTLMVNLGVNHDIKISFTALPDPNISSLMLFIEDKIHINQEAQQLKLASLGRLTSSIAHEIRNPLAAISHASQLLDESEHMHTSDQELLGMIHINSQRIDQTINNILQFSRRKEANTEVINICQWLQQFISTYCIHIDSDIIFNAHKENIFCSIDPNHLQQIMTNIVDNGLRHSQKEGVDNRITIEANINNASKLPFIDIIDEGDGINDEHIDTIFEPFYTTKTTGSGLGLYLCKELCQANKANIIYLKKTETQKSCFRLMLCQPYTSTRNQPEK